MKRYALTLTGLLALGLTVPTAFSAEPLVPASKSATGPALRHIFLAVDESRKQIHYVDQNDPSRDWSVATVHNGKPLCIRDLALAGAQRLVMAARNGEGIFVLDLQSRQYWRIGSGGASVQPTLTGYDLTPGNPMARPMADGGWVLGSGGDLVTKGVDGAIGFRATIEKTRPAVYHAVRLADGGFLAAIGYGAAVVRLDAQGKELRRYPVPGAFAGGFQVLANNNIVASAWNGHGPNDSSRQRAQLVEFDPAGNEVWSFHDPKRMGSLHHVLVLDGLDLALPHQQIDGQIKPLGDTRVPRQFAEIRGNSLDGLAVLPDGRVAVNVPNLNDQKTIGNLALVDAAGVVTAVVLPPPAPGTDRMIPWGMDADAEGNLYVADNQFFSQKNPKPASRLWRRRADGTWTLMVSGGLRIANGVRVHQGFVYVTDSQCALLPPAAENQPQRLVSALYRFPLTAENLDLGADPLSGPQLVARFEQAVNRDPFGADGVVFDETGQCLVSFFDLGGVAGFPIDAQGRGGPLKWVIPVGTLASADGMAYHSGTKSLFIADYRANSIHRWSYKTGVTVFSRHTLGQEAARLDQPVDVVVRGDEVIVSNWTSTGRPCIMGCIPIMDSSPETNKGAKK